MGIGIRKAIKFAVETSQVGKGRLIRTFGGVEQLCWYMKKVGKGPIKRLLLAYGATIGAKSDIETDITFHNVKGDFANLRIESECHIGKDVFLDLKSSIIILARSTISMRSMILTHVDPGKSHWLLDHCPKSEGQVTIGPDSYIGAGVIVCPGVTIGRESIVTAGSVVNKDVPQGILAGGVPARFIRYLDENF
jgi:acetyltransferase-like isoleucine patch superfamily enzyme